MNIQETNAIFRYLLDSITLDQRNVPHAALPKEIKEDIEFAVWMKNLDFSEDSQIKSSLRNSLQKHSELMSNASKLRTEENLPRLEVKKPLSLPVLISIIAGSLSILTATIFVIFQKSKKKLSDEHTFQP